jgi:hypothetical protein
VAWILDWSAYVLPAISNLILVMVGIIMSLPNLADQVEKTPKHRKILAGICLIAGLVGFVFDVAQRRTSDLQSKQIFGEVQTSLENTKTLVTNTNNLVINMDAEIANSNKTVTNTDSIVTKFGVLLPRMKAMDTNISDLKVKINDPNVNPKLAASMKSNLADLLNEREKISKQLLVAQVPNIIEEIRGWRDSMLFADSMLSNVYYDRSMSGQITTQEQRQELMDEETRKRAESQQKFISQIPELFTRADNLRHAMLQKIPLTAQTPEDRTEIENFAAIIRTPNEGMNFVPEAIYLESLAKRMMTIQ